MRCGWIITNVLMARVKLSCHHDDSIVQRRRLLLLTMRKSCTDLEAEEDRPVSPPPLQLSSYSPTVSPERNRNKQHYFLSSNIFYTQTGTDLWSQSVICGELDCVPHPDKVPHRFPASGPPPVSLQLRVRGSHAHSLHCYWVCIHWLTVQCLNNRQFRNFVYFIFDFYKW